MAKQGGQFMSAQDYSYTGLDSYCELDYSKLIGKITSFQLVNEDDENDLKLKLANFISYAGGILDNDQCEKMDHGVVVVGYGEENGVDYLIVRNSLGKFMGLNTTYLLFYPNISYIMNNNQKYWQEVFSSYFSSSLFFILEKNDFLINKLYFFLELIF